MVFESVVTDVLNRFLGDYIENLDSKQLKLGIWGGDIVLTNLHLKQNALKDLDLPMQTIYGRLDKLVVKIPWSNLYGAAVEATVEGLYILLAPNHQVEYNAEKEAAHEYAFKTSQLKKIDDRKKLAEVAANTDDTFVEKLVTQIIKNVQLRIRNIHIRYEDSSVEPAYAMGVTLSDLVVQTTNDKWQPTVLSEVVQKIYKIVTLEGLAVYWNCGTEMFSEFPEETRKEMFVRDIATKQSTPENYKYILGPINSESRLVLNPKPQNNSPPFELPKARAELKIETLSVGISSCQYKDIVKFADSMQLQLVGIPYRKYRPNVPHAGHAKEWWLFAYTCILETDVRRKRLNWDWDHMVEHRELCKRYGQLYKAKLTSKKLAPGDDVEYVSCEKHLDIYNLVLIRQKISLEVERLDKMRKEQQPKSWFSGWFGASKSSIDEEEQTKNYLKRFQAAMTPDEKKKLFEAIDYDESDAPAPYPDDYVDTVVKFELKQFKFNIRNDTRAVTSVIKLKLTDVKTCVSRRPKLNGLRVQGLIGNLLVTGVAQNDIIPELISSKVKYKEELSNLMEITFEMNPLDLPNGNRVNVSANPLQVIYDFATIEEVVKVFHVPSSSALEELSKAAAQQVNDVKEKSALGLQSVIEKHTKLDLDLNLSAPIVIIPSGGLYTGGENVLVVNFGTLRVKSVIAKDIKAVSDLIKSGFAKTEVMDQMMLQSYDRFQVNLEGLQVLIAQSDENWLDQVLSSGDSQMNLLCPINISVLVETCIIQDPSMPTSKISAEVPSIYIKISDARLYLALALLDSLGKQFNADANKLTRSVSTSSLRALGDKTSIAAKKAIIPPVERSSVQMTLLRMKFELQSFRFSFLHQDTVADPLSPVFDLLFTSLTLEFYEKTHSRHASTCLESINMQQYINGDTLDIISTRGLNGEKLFKVDFTQVQKRHPEFSTTYGNTLLLLAIHFRILQMNLYHAALVELMKYANNIQMELSEEEGGQVSAPSIHRRTSSSSMSSTRMMREAMTRAIENIPTKDKKPEHPSINTFKLEASLEAIEIKFYDPAALSDISVSGFHADVAISSHYTKIQCYLNSVNVLDLNPLTKHPRIIFVDEVTKMIDVQVVLYNDPTPSEPDILIKASMGKLCVTFLYWYFSNMLNFLNSFTSAREAIFAASQRAAQAAKENLENMYVKSKKVSLDLEIHAPQIIIPEKSNSYDALFVNLGLITISNFFNALDITNEHGDNVVVDEMQCKLVMLSVESIALSQTLEIVHKVPILEPLSFTVQLSRNMSPWYTAIPDIDVNGVMDTINVKLGQSDYTTLMNILNENMHEGDIVVYEEALQGEVLEIALETGASLFSTAASQSTRILQDDNEDAFIRTNFRWKFAMHSFVINLYIVRKTIVSGPKRVDLGQLKMEGFLVRGRMLSNNSISNNLLLMNLELNDTRPNPRQGIREIFYRTPAGLEEAVATMTSSFDVPPQSVLQESRNMIDMTLQTKKSDTFIDLRVYSFTFLLSVEYLTQLSAFFTEATDEISKQAPTVAKKASHVHEKRKVEKSTETNALVSMAIKLEKPDIVLVESMDDITTRALILNCELLMKLRLVGNKQTMNGTLSDLQMYTCIFDPLVRDSTKNMFLEPFTLSIAGSTPEGKGLHIEAYMTTIFIGVSVYTIELLNNCLKTVTRVADPRHSMHEERKDMSQLWEMRENRDFWFLQTEEGEDALKSKLAQPVDKSKILNELCFVNVPQIIITLQAGVGHKTYPVLALEATFHGKVVNWSSQMYVEATLSLQMGYYNSVLALWEPIIEPVITPVDEYTEPKTTPWEIRLEINMNERDEKEDDADDDSEDPTSVSKDLVLQPAMTIDVTSTHNLEMTITKTALDVLMNTAKIFTVATTSSSEDLKRSEANGLYKIVNTIGCDVIITIDPKYLVHKSNVAATTIKLEGHSEVYLDPVVVRGPKEKVDSFCSYGAVLHEKFITVEVPQFHVSLSVPYQRAVSRYYRLPDGIVHPNRPSEKSNNWGIVSEVCVVDGISVVTLCSVLQVFNSFNVPVDIYYMRQSGNELELIETIQPKCTLHIPLNAVYSATSELFFSIEGYAVTAIPYVWRDLQLNVAVNKTLTCTAKDNTKHYFVIKVIGEMHQIFFENTTKYTMSSTMYKINLRPAVIFKNCLPYDVQISVEDPLGVTLGPGNSLELPNVDPGQTHIIIRLPKYLDKSWVCKREIPLVPQEFSVWTLDSHDSIAKMSLDLGMHCLNVNGSYMLTLYCPFWMMNKTGLDLSYRTTDENTNVLYHPAYLNDPILFSFNAKNFFGKKKACVKVNQGDWCEKFSIDVAGSSGVILCLDEGKYYQIGVQNQLTYNGLTKIVTFMPYYVIINQSSHPIECQEDKRPADPWLVARPLACVAFWPVSDAEDKLIRVRMPNTEEISIPFLITESHTTLVKLKNQYGGVNVDIQMTEGSLYINLTLYNNGMAPALVINSTEHTMNIWEKKSVHIHKLLPNHNMFFTWDYPSSDRILVWEAGYKAEVENELRMDGVGSYEIASGIDVFWVSFLDGMQRVLLFTNDSMVANNAQATKEIEIIDREITISLHGLGLSVVNNHIREEILYIAIASTGIIWETCKAGGKRYKQMNTASNIATENEYQQFLAREGSSSSSSLEETIAFAPHMEVDFKKMLQLKPKRRQLQRRFQTGIWVQMKTSEHQMQLHAKINRLQIDNQLHDCTFPVMLAPVPPPKSVVVTDANKPFAEVSIVQLLMKNSQIQQYKYFKVLIQEFHIKVDLGLINSVVEMLNATEKSEEDLKEYFLADVQTACDSLYSNVSQISLQEQKSFYDLLHFSPLKIHVSFSMTQNGQNSGTSNLPVFLGVLLQGIGVTLTDMQDVVFKLAYFERDYMFLTQRQLTNEAIQHYVGQTVKQLYVLVLGLDVIGNPYGLVLGITKGVEDLFYEPFQGAIQGPGEFAEGLAFGVASLFGHTFGGAAGAVSRITGAMGKGIAALSFDKEYQRKRRDQLNRRPATAKEGFARGGKGLVMGVFDGVTGVFTKPISGAKEQGIGGFFKGLGKGAVGLVARPTAGVMDFASSSLDSVKRVTEFGTAYVSRIRPPRFIPTDKLVKPYNPHTAAGNKFLVDVDKGKYYSTDLYVNHYTIIDKKDFFLITDKRIAYISHNDIFGGWQVDWTHTYQELSKVPAIHEKGVIIYISEAKKRFKSSESSKVLLVSNPVTCQRIIADITKFFLLWAGSYTDQAVGTT